MKLSTVKMLLEFFFILLGWFILFILWHKELFVSHSIEINLKILLFIIVWSALLIIILDALGKSRHH